MNTIPLWAQIIIALFGAGAVGGIAGAFSPIFTTQLAYRQKMNETRHTNARAHIETVYKPINISLSRLAEKYEYYKSYRRSYETSKTAITFVSDAKEREFLVQIGRKEYAGYLKARQDFILACNAYLDLMSEVANQGNDQYITSKLEERLRSFTTFIQTFMMTATFQEDIDEVFNEEDKARAKSFLTLAGSSDFTQRFEKDIHDLKSYIKDVTLG